MQISISRLRSYLQCPMLFRWRYVEHAEPEYTSADMVFGQRYGRKLCMGRMKQAAYPWWT